MIGYSDQGGGALDDLDRLVAEARAELDRQLAELPPDPERDRALAEVYAGGQLSASLGDMALWALRVELEIVRAESEADMDRIRAHLTTCPYCGRPMPGAQVPG